MSPPPLRFDWVISLGQVLTAATLIITASIAYANLDRAVAEHERRLAAVETLAGQAQARLAQADVTQAETRAQIDRLEELMGEVRDELRQINRRGQP